MRFSLSAEFVFVQRRYCRPGSGIKRNFLRFFLNIWAWLAASFSLPGTTFGTDIKVNKDSNLLQDRRT
jgi:hypothetical protein